MGESIVVVGAALSADVDAPTERVHSAPGARRGQENIEEFRVGGHGDGGEERIVDPATVERQK